MWKWFTMRVLINGLGEPKNKLLFSMSYVVQPYVFHQSLKNSQQLKFRNAASLDLVNSGKITLT
jgi:hypothetical protein